MRLVPGIGQEAQHFRQHRVLNDILRGCHSEYAGLQAIEDRMEADYQYFTKTKSLKFNLAYAEGFEAATCALARNSLQYVDMEAEPCGIGRLLSWHLTEEIEHRTVTFNIYEHPWRNVTKNVKNEMSSEISNEMPNERF